MNLGLFAIDVVMGFGESLFHLGDNLRMKNVTWTILLVVVLMAALSAGCATNTSRADHESECDYAMAKYREMQESVRLYYALGTTSVAEIAIAERRLKKAKKEAEAACHVQLPDVEPPETQESPEENGEEQKHQRDGGSPQARHSFQRAHPKENVSLHPPRMLRL
jgi:hypothetical protein